MNPYHSQPQHFAHSPSNPPQFVTGSLTSPPPIIQVSMAERQVRINPPLTPPPSQAPPSLPQYSPHASPPTQQQTLAQQEKEDYYNRAMHVDPYGGMEGPTNPPMSKPNTRAIPAPILLPPKAAFAHSESPLQSPASLKQAQAFGDVGSIRSGNGGTSLLMGGRGAADVRKSGLDWSRFSVLVKESEKESRSDWLAKKQGVAKKWFVLGWIGAILLVVAIILGVVVGVKHHSDDDGTPKVPNLGIFNSKDVHQASSSANPIISTVPPRASSSSAATLSSSQSRATPAVLEDTDSSTRTTSSAAGTSTTSTQARVVSQSTTSSSRQTTTSSLSIASSTTTARARVASTTTTTTSASPSSSSSTAASSRSTSDHRRRFLNHASFVALRASFVDEPMGRYRREVAEEPGTA